MRTLPTIATLAIATMLSACGSIGMPNLSDVAAPFRSDAQDIPRSPRLSDAPVRPGDDRTAAQWDASARALIAERDQLAPPAGGPEPTPAELERDIERLKSEVRAYKLDDPQ